MNYSHEPIIIVLSLKYVRAEHILLTREIKFTKRTIKTTPLIDSGATAIFVDKEFCDVHHLPLQKKIMPQTDYVVDRESIKSGPITHECHLPITLSKHHQTTTFPVTSLDQYLIILGLL
jgi:hypothetical protein